MCIWYILYQRVFFFKCFLLHLDLEFTEHWCRLHKHTHQHIFVLVVLVNLTKLKQNKTRTLVLLFCTVSVGVYFFPEVYVFNFILFCF